MPKSTFIHQTYYKCLLYPQKNGKPNGSVIEKLYKINHVVGGQHYLHSRPIQTNMFLLMGEGPSL